MTVACCWSCCCSELLVLSDEVNEFFWRRDSLDVPIWNTSGPEPLRLYVSLMNDRPDEPTRMSWAIGPDDETQTAFVVSTGRPQGEFRCPSYDDLWLEMNPSTDSWDVPSSLSVRCVVDTAPTFPICSVPLTRVPWWSAFLFGVILACGLVVVVRSDPHACANATKSLPRLLCWIFHPQRMGFFTFILAFSLWYPNSCSAYAMYPVVMGLICDPAIAGSQKSPIAVFRKVRPFVSFARALLGIFVFAFILPIPCALNNVHGTTWEIEGIPVPLRRDVCIYPYASILMAFLLWLPDCIVQGRRGALRKARLRKVIPRPTRPRQTSSPAPSQHLSTGQDQATQTHSQKRGCAKQCVPAKAQLKEKLLMLAIAGGLCYPLGVWDAFAVLELLVYVRLCYAMLRDQVWADDASNPLVETPLGPIPPQLGAADLTDSAGGEAAQHGASRYTKSRKAVDVMALLAHAEDGVTLEATALADFEPEADVEMRLRRGETIALLQGVAPPDGWVVAVRRGSSEGASSDKGLVPATYVELLPVEHPPHIEPPAAAQVTLDTNSSHSAV